MNATTAAANDATIVAVDLAKSVFQLVVANGTWKVMESHRLTRTQFERWFVNRQVNLVIMEACGSAHHWARCYATLRDQKPYGAAGLNKKITRSAFAIPA